MNFYEEERELALWNKDENKRLHKRFSREIFMEGKYSWRSILCNYHDMLREKGGINVEIQRIPRKIRANHSRRYSREIFKEIRSVDTKKRLTWRLDTFPTFPKEFWPKLKFKIRKYLRYFGN